MPKANVDLQREQEWRDSIKHLIGSKVQVEYTRSHDVVSSTGTLRGWLYEHEGRPILLQRRGSKRFVNLTGGMFDGFYATITAISIKQIA